MSVSHKKKPGAKYTMTEAAHAQRVKAGFVKDPAYSGKWTNIRIRPEDRDAIKERFGSLVAGIKYLVSLPVPKKDGGNR